MMVEYGNQLVANAKIIGNVENAVQAGCVCGFYRVPLLWNWVRFR